MVSPRVTALRSPQLDGSSEDLDLPGRGLDTSSGDLSCDSRANSDYEDTDGGYTDGEGSGPQDADEEPPVPALARSSEPAWVEDHEELRGHGGITAEFEPQVGTAPRSGTLLCAWSPPNPLCACQRVTAFLFPPGWQPPPPGPVARGQHAVSALEGRRATPHPTRSGLEYRILRDAEGLMKEGHWGCGF